MEIFMGPLKVAGHIPAVPCTSSLQPVSSLLFIALPTRVVPWCHPHSSMAPVEVFMEPPGEAGTTGTVQSSALRPPEYSLRFTRSTTATLRRLDLYWAMTAIFMGQPWGSFSGFLPREL